MKNIPLILTTGLALGLVSCYSYDTASNYHVPASGAATKKDGSTKRTSPGGTRRGSVQFPARVAIARVESQKWGNGVRLFDGQDLEKPEHAHTISRLPGVAGMVSLNNVSLQNGAVDYPTLRQEALELGAPLLAVYRFNTTHQSVDNAGVLNVAALGILPSVSHQVVSNVSLIVQDARTGYTYGVLEEQASTKVGSTQWGLGDAQKRATQKTRQEAFDQLVTKLPAFWGQISR